MLIIIRAILYEKCCITNTLLHTLNFLSFVPDKSIINIQTATMEHIEEIACAVFVVSYFCFSPIDAAVKVTHIFTYCICCSYYVSIICCFLMAFDCQ